MLRESAVTGFEVLYRNLLEETEENQDTPQNKPCSIRDSNLARTAFKLEPSSLYTMEEIRG
jgi:hypothetical protein